MNMKKSLSKLDIVSNGTVQVNDLGKEPSLNLGQVATLPKRNRNTAKSSVEDLEVGDVIHYDIGHGTGSAIGGIRYTLVLIDKKSSHLFEYGLKSVKENSILAAIKKFVNDLGRN